jgi:putative PIN family toxin of toxin-antitoxin system
MLVDTSVFVSALISADGANRQMLRLCLQGAHTPIVGKKLFQEYEDVSGCDLIFERSLLTKEEREELLNGFVAVCEWTPDFFLWRPIPDKGDNHLIELAVAGGADAIITYNIKDFNRAELKFPDFNFASRAILNPNKLILWPTPKLCDARPGATQVPKSG